MTDSVLAALAVRLVGELRWDGATRTMYATDASEYEVRPAAVAFPAAEDDLRELIAFAQAQRIGLIPRGAGTSLAGQVVGSGLVVDCGRHLNRIIAIDPVRRRVRVQPGVIRNELNQALRPHGLFFAPETSTANRAMIGGMVGNNSCGANSIVYGSTRDHLIGLRGFLSDGSPVAFGPLTAAEFAGKCAGPDTRETRLYRRLRDLLGDPGNRRLIREHFPKPAVTRRNTGYALDALADSALFEPAAADRPFNLCRLLAGSEGTLVLGVEFELDCSPLPPPGALLCAHFSSVSEALGAVAIALRRQPSAVELIDRHVLECTRRNPEQARNRFFVQGDPGAILVIEIRREERAEIEGALRALEADLRGAGLGHAFPVLWGPDCDRVWDLRRAGQGVLSNVVGDARPREVVEDTAVAVEDLPAYIDEFQALMRSRYGIECVYYAHAGAGELHTRPLFDLKTAEGLARFRAIATDVAILVKKYRGSLSGEHGDGRLRGEFIRFMVGDACYAMMREIKALFDPAGLFNPGKIIDPPPMDAALRHGPGQTTPDYATVFDFSATLGVVRAAEKCNGSGDCRKLPASGGTMCPSYMATRDERDSTRARANVLRQALAHPADPARPWVSAEVTEVMDRCLSCKACRSECPSTVDVARLKAEWRQHDYDARGVPLRTRLVAGHAGLARIGMLAPGLHNGLLRNRWMAGALKRAAGFAAARDLPMLPPATLRRWHGRNANRSGSYPNGPVFLFADEFTNFHDAEVGIKAVRLLNRLGYAVIIPEHGASGRAQLSKGLVRAAQALAARNVERLQGVVTGEAALIGLEPSAILGFRDEYPDLVPARLKGAARDLAGRALLFDEFLAREADRGRIGPAAFTTAERTVLVHGHCHQKALASLAPTVRALGLPANYRVTVIPSGCCGMAGAFGYEAEHYELSMRIGELVLFPAVRAAPADALIAAAGTSCRQQIRDGTGRRAGHPAEILHDSLA
jgi:FAD/FMN-containing dehydrogenase/Fe-S oxidoreductase